MYFVTSQIFLMSLCVCVCVFREVLQPLSDLSQFKKKQEALQHTAIPAHLAEEHQCASVH